MTEFNVNFLSHNRKAKCAPNPAYPNGMDVDMTHGAKLACLVELPYPAECCGVWLVECQSCGLRVGITAAGRSDDPRSAKLPCKRIADAPEAASAQFPCSRCTDPMDCGSWAYCMATGRAWPERKETDDA